MFAGSAPSLPDTSAHSDGSQQRRPAAGEVFPTGLHTEKVIVGLENIFFFLFLNLKVDYSHHYMIILRYNVYTSAYTLDRTLQNVSF